MIILALDSTSTTASVALCEDERLICLYTVSAGNTHSETLLPMIESALRTSELELCDVDMLAVSEGPGSFTGVRIGAATAKGLAFGTNKPCVGVSTLWALAYNLMGLGCNAIICPVMNARRSQVYNAIFRLEDGRLTRLCNDRVLTIAELESELLGEYSQDKIYLVGDVYDVTLDGFERVTVEVTAEPMRYHNAYSVAQCAHEKYLSSDGSADTFTDSALAPTYLRPSQAERERLEREGKAK